MTFKIIGASCSIVLCQLLAVLAYGQTDTTLVFTKTGSELNAGNPELKKPHLSGIISASLGAFNGHRSDGSIASFLQPSVGFDFLAEPGDFVHLLLGGRLGISNPLTTEALFGFRQTIASNTDHSTYSFGDLALIFFDDAKNTEALKTGVRLGFGIRSDGPVNMEYKLAGEFRGTGISAIDSTSHAQWWVGLEVGVAFSLVSAPQRLTRKDSIRAEILYIASSEELDEFDALTSTAKVDEWLAHFWKRRDVTPDTRVNEAEIEFYRRAKMANERFSQPRRLGVKTDPGRVLMIYGQPDYLETGSSDYGGQNLYTMWIYRNRISSQPTAVFLFRNHFREEPKQIYSNVPGELSEGIPDDIPKIMLHWVQ